MSTHVSQGEASLKTGGDPTTTLKLLDESVTHLRQASDLAGLAVVEAEAKALAVGSEGRTRKKAERIGRKASLAVESLRRSGVETHEERETREARERQQALRENQEARNKLDERIVSLLHLLLNDGNPAAATVAVLRSLAVADGEGFVRIEIPIGVGSSSSLLLDGYLRSRELFGEVGAKSLQKEWKTVDRTLKTVAVDLMSAGAEVRGLTADAVPLLAYALFNGLLPDPSDPAFATAVEKVDNLLLAIADDVSAMPIDARPLQIGLYRLALLLGEAQAYAEKLSLTALSIS